MNANYRRNTHSKPVRLIDIANRSGVSVSTVSRILNKRKFHDRISQRVKQNVLRVANELGYIPHHGAQSLVTNKSMVVGIYMHVPPQFVDKKNYFIGQGYSAEVITYADQFLRDRGYSLMISNLTTPEQSLKRCISQVYQRQVDGVLVVYSAEPQEVYRLKEGNIPVVLIDYEGPEVPVSYVSLDNYEAIKLAIMHLYDLGHRKIAFLGSAFSPPFNDIQARRDAFVSIMKKLKLNPKYVFHHPDFPDMPDFTYTLEFQFAQGRWVVDYIFKLPESERPTALVTICDTQAYTAIIRMQEIGLKVPDDLSIVGFDESVWARWAPVPITTISHNLENITIRACQILLDEIEQYFKGEEYFNIKERLPPKLIIRKSTGKVKVG